MFFHVNTQKGCVVLTNSSVKHSFKLGDMCVSVLMPAFAHVGYEAGTVRHGFIGGWCGLD